MTKLEFETVLENLSINNQIAKENNIYKWHNLEIFYNDNGYVEILGNIPSEIPINISKKYPNNPYSIKINDGSVESKPIDFSKIDCIGGFSVKTVEGLKVILNELQKFYLRNNMDQLKIKRLELTAHSLFKDDIEEYKNFEMYLIDYEKKILNDIKKPEIKNQLKKIANIRVEEFKRNINTRKQPKHIK